MTDNKQMIPGLVLTPIHIFIQGAKAYYTKFDKTI